MKTLVGHVSAETAFVQPDYPYSFKLRCERRVWVETKPGYGQRVVFQTKNPKTGRWNAPKAGTYSQLAAIGLDDDPASATFGHVILGAFTGWRGKDELEGFLIMFGEAVDPKIAQALRDGYARLEAHKLAKLQAAAVAACVEPSPFDDGPPADLGGDRDAIAGWAEERAMAEARDR